MQVIKPIMVPVYEILSTQQVRATNTFPPPLNMAPLPPMIVTEKGEALDDFMGRAEPDFFTSIQACSPRYVLAARVPCAACRV